MALEYFYKLPERVLCVKVKVPVVLAEEEVQVVVDNISHTPELIKKVDRIDTRLDDLECRPIFLNENNNNWNGVIRDEGWEKFGWHCKKSDMPILKKILVSGILHKQVFYVNRDDDVRHFGEDIPFTSEVTLTRPTPVLDEDEVHCQFHKKKIDMRWQLRGGSRLSQTGVIIIKVKVVEERPLWVMVCPRPIDECKPGKNLLKDGGFERWGTPYNPIFWGASNVMRSEESSKGSYSAELGADPSQPASLFQTVDKILPDADYRMCFHVKENVKHYGVASFTLEAELAFYDDNGDELRSKRETFMATNIPDDSFKRFCIEAKAPSDAVNAVVRFTFTPHHSNTSRVKIDDVLLECQRVDDKHKKHHHFKW